MFVLIKRNSPVLLGICKKEHMEYLKEKNGGIRLPNLCTLPHGVELSRVHPADNGEIAACES